MGKFEKYFFMGVPETLIYIGVIMSTLSFATAGINFFVTFNIVTAQFGGDLVPLMFFTFFACCTYLVSGISHCSNICCRKAFNRDIKKSFKQYLISMQVSIVFAAIDAILKFDYNVVITKLLCGYIFGTIIAIIIVSMAKHELVTERITVVQNYNCSQVPVTAATGHDGMPKYPMAISAERV